MLEFYAKPLFEASHHLTVIEGAINHALSQFSQQQQPMPRFLRIEPQDYDRVFKGILQAFRDNVHVLGLWMTEKTVGELENALRNGKETPILQFLITELRSRFSDEVEAVKLLCIQRERTQYYESTDPLFGERALTLFPSAADDIAEAGKCLALDRSTACVFHLMRATEVGLKAVARELGIPYAPSWESYIKQIKNKIEEDWSKKTPEWKAREPLFRDLLGDLQAMKRAWRNPTMHIVKKFLEEEALNIFGATKTFMSRLASNGIGERTEQPPPPDEQSAPIS